MSFFGLDSSRGGHNTSAPGFSQASNPFAGLSQRNDDDEALDFEETYDGLGDQLDEGDDVLNDDTFGDGGVTSSGKVGKDFDFFGETARVSNAIDEEHMRFDRQAPKVAAKPAQPVQAPYYTGYGETSYKPVRSGYEQYKEEPINDLQVDAALWGVAPKKQPQAAPAPSPGPAPPAPAGRKILSLEEVEAQMRAGRAQKAAQPAQPVEPVQEQYAQPPHGPASYEPLAQRYQQGPVFPPQPPQDNQQQSFPPQLQQHHGHGHPITILQRPQSKHAASAEPGYHSPPKQQQHQAPPIQPIQVLQNPNRLSGDAARLGQAAAPSGPHPHASQVPHQQLHGHRQQASFSRLPPNLYDPHMQQHMNPEEKEAFTAQAAKQAKRNHKIFLLSRDNGLMTPQDKNFITRIQLQQLVSATGNPNEHTTDETLSEDFYYQVYTQIQGLQRQHPNQPLTHFAQTYLFQTGSRQGGRRMQNRGPENHMQRMEQQVQRAVEAAKNRPKNKQLVIEGSLGKISFSNSKTPKPLLNIKRQDSDVSRPASAPKDPHGPSAIDLKSVLRAVEQVYSTLMQMEDHDRRMPAPPQADDDEDTVRRAAEWREKAAALNDKLWRDLKVHDPIGATPVHPFIAFLSYAKGKKAIPRVFRHISHEQRKTILTMIIIHLDKLDVVRGAEITNGEAHMNAAMRENVELFSQTVMNSLFGFMNDIGLDIVTGVMGLISDHINVDLVARTRIGASMLTLILSRAAILKQAGGGDDESWKNWDRIYNNFFNILEPTLQHIFPGSVTSGEDVYVWQLLAALGIGANLDQQQRLVLAVKRRVLDTVALARTLPAEMGAQRLQNVNLFMHSLGLDTALL